MSSKDLHGAAWRLSAAAALAALLLACSDARAQLPDWDSLAISPAASLHLEQNQAIVQEGATVRAFSCATRAWTSVTAVFTPSPTVNVRNEHCLVQDGPFFYGYSPRSGSFSTMLALNPGASIVPASSPQTWHSIVADGNYVHVFFAISGQWQTYLFASAPTVTNGRYCLLIDDGSTIFGVSSFYGSLVPLPASGATVTGTWGNMALASTGSMVYGFSASRNTWTSMPVAGSVSVTTGNSQPTCLSIEDGTQVAFFSGTTGTFAVTPASPSASVTLERATGVVLDGATAYAYSALLGTVSSMTFSVPPMALVQQYYVMLQDGLSVTPYSASTASFGLPYPVPLSQLTATGQVALASDPGGTPLAAWSAYRNVWVPAPATVSPTAHVSAASVVLEEAGGGLYGYSMRGLTWAYQPTPPLAWAQVGNNPPQLAETFAAATLDTLYAFNVRNGKWRSTPTLGAASLRRAHYHVILCGDGMAAYAFSAWNDRWATELLPAGTLLTGGNSNAQVQSAYVFDGSVLHTYSGVGQLSIMGEYPHFYRVASQGSLFRLDLAAEAGSQAVLAVSPLGAEINLGAPGVLRLQPVTTLILALPVVPESRDWQLTFQIPYGLLGTGTELHFQAIAAGPSGLYLTNDAVATIY